MESSSLAWRRSAVRQLVTLTVNTIEGQRREGDEGEYRVVVVEQDADCKPISISVGRML